MWEPGGGSVARDLIKQGGVAWTELTKLPLKNTCSFVCYHSVFISCLKNPK